MGKTTITIDEAGFGGVTIDGHAINCYGVRVAARPGDKTTAEVDIFPRDMDVELSTEFVWVSDHTAEALKALGWTPPEDGDPA